MDSKGALAATEEVTVCVGVTVRDGVAVAAAVTVVVVEAVTGGEMEGQGEPPAHVLESAYVMFISVVGTSMEMSRTVTAK